MRKYWWSRVFEKAPNGNVAPVGCLLPGFVLRCQAAGDARVTGLGSPAPAEGLPGVAVRGGRLRRRRVGPYLDRQHGTWHSWGNLSRGTGQLPSGPSGGNSPRSVGAASWAKNFCWQEKKKKKKKKETARAKRRSLRLLLLFGGEAACVAWRLAKKCVSTASPSTGETKWSSWKTTQEMST